MIIRSAGLNNNAHDVYYTIDELRETGKSDTEADIEKFRSIMLEK